MRWLTANELAIELGVDPRFIYSLYKLGQIQGVGTNRATMRYLDPGPELAKRVHLEPLDTAALITTKELAEVLGVNYATMRQWIVRGHVKPDVDCGRAGLYFNRTTVRALLAKREGRRGRSKFTYSAIIVKWLRGWLNTHTAPVQVLDSMIQEVAKNVPDPDKTLLIKRLWDLFEEVNQILKTRQGG